MTSLTPHRLPIRDRAHAGAIARQLPLGDLFKNGGSVDGFADWLFVNRRTFNGRNPLQQANVYANRHWSASKRGAAFDSLCREDADRKVQAWKRASAELDASVAAIEAWWSETPVGADITLAAVELCLGGGTCFAQSLDGVPSSECHPSWVLERLLAVLVGLGGPDDLLEKHEWIRQSSENHFRQTIESRGASLANLRTKLARGEAPTELDVVAIALCTNGVSRLPGVRTLLRTHVVRATMSEGIRVAAPAVKNARPPSRRVRDV